jgi:hypothetical protein
MSDSFSRLNDLERMVRDSTAASHLRFLDAQVRDSIRPLREPYLMETYLSRAIKDIAEEGNLTRRLMESIAPVGTQTLFAEIERQATARDEFLETIRASAAGSHLLFKQLQDDITARLHVLDRGLGTSLQLELQRIGEATETFRFTTASAAIATALDGWRSTLDYLHDINDTGFASALFANPLLESVRSIRASSAMLARHPADSMERAIEQSILLCDAELRTANDTIVSLPPPDEELIVAPPRRLYVPQVHRIELRRMQVDLADADIDELFVALPSGQLVLLAREVIDLVVDINEARTVSGGELIFKLTLRVMRVCAELPFAIALDRSTFADFIDDLYWLLYEGPGANSLRYITAHGGPFDASECEIIFVIKRLRNFYRHDVEHGSDSDIKKKFEAITADLSPRGFVVLPRTRDDYRRLQRVLLEEVTTFLRALQEKVA